MTIDQTYDPAVPIDSLRRHPENPRQGDIGAIHQSIQANGFYGAVIVQKSTGFILAGNHRWEAARHAGLETIPAHLIDVDDDRARRILLVDNRTNDLASYDDAELIDLLKTIRDGTGTLDGTGFDGDDLDQLIADVMPDFAPTDEEPARLDQRKPVTCPECGHEFTP